MANVIPLRPFENAIEQARRAGHPEWRSHCIKSVLRDLRSGRNGYAVAGQIQALRADRATRCAPPAGSAA